MTVKNRFIEIETADRHWTFMSGGGRCFLSFNGPIYRFQIELGRFMGLTFGEKNI